jgi:asparagine synthetase B (glutamine-hydrolysing)
LVFSGFQADGRQRINRFRSPDGTVTMMRLFSNIMDPATAQLAQSPQGNRYLFLDGEIFNDDMSDANPPAAILRAYEREGNAVFARLNGSFTLAIYEPEMDRLILVCDRTASRPIFYLKNDHQFVFSSRLKPFTRLRDFHAKVNPLALSNFLACGFILETNTMLDDVKVLGPAQVLVLEHGQLSISEYWNFSFNLTSHTDDGMLADEMVRLIYRAVQRQSQVEKPIGIPLSGGYDSRVLAGCLHRLRPREAIRTITWGEDETSRESDAAISHLLAEQMGVRHAFFKLKPEALPDHFYDFVTQSEGRTDAVGNYPEGLNIFERIRGDLNVGMLLRGDECFGWKEKAFTEHQMLHSMSIHHLDNLRQSYRFLKPVVRKRLAPQGRDQLLRLLRDCPHGDLLDRDHYFFLNQRLFGYLHPLSQLKQLVIPLRNPFMDVDILDFVRYIPARLRECRSLFKVASQRMFPEFHKIGFARCSNLINWDLRLGLDSGLRSYIVQVLLEHRNGFDELIDRRQLERYLDQTFSKAIKLSRLPTDRKLPLRTRARRRIAHYTGLYDLNPAEQIFRLMILKIWVDEYLNGNFDMA